MKKIIGISIALALCCAVIFFSFRISSLSANSQAGKISEQTLPDFRFYTLDSAEFSAGGLSKNKNIVVIHFDPECEYCTEETDLIVKNMDAFNSTEIVMVSENTPDKIKGFVNNFHLDKIEGIQVLWDKDRQFSDLFGRAMIPSTFIYNSERKLIRKYHGLVKLEAITRWLK